MQSRTRTSRFQSAQFEPLEGRRMLSGWGDVDLSGVDFRSIDGTGNNLAAPEQGAANTRLIRFGYPARYPDGFGDAIDVPGRPNARDVSNAVHAQSAGVASARRLTDWVTQWGQFLTHDTSLTPAGRQFNTLSTGGTGDFRIAVNDPSDPLGPRPVPFNRSDFDPATGTPGVPRQQMNRITSYIDASNVYGSDAARAAALRTFEGGKLKTTAGGLLPGLNDVGLPNDDPFHLGGQLFLAGDARANEQVGLTATHALFVREHNRLARVIAQNYRHLGDEEIYQVARSIVAAEMQIITYEEYLPAVLGEATAPRPEDAAYSPDVRASITNSFSASIFRFGHSQVSDATQLVTARGHSAGSVTIQEAFFNPDFLKDDPGNVELVLKGLASQAGQEVDLLMVDGIRNSLFGPPGAGGLDLAALDIQRGRDHGLPDYNSMRAFYHLPRVSTFEQVSSDPQVRAKLAALYGTVDNIDSFVGALAEDHLPGSSVGALAGAVMANQFTRLRDGDRFFYANDPFLASDAVERVIDLNDVSLAQVIRWNSGVPNIRVQDNVFYLGRPGQAGPADAGAVTFASGQVVPLTAVTRDAAPADEFLSDDSGIADEVLNAAGDSQLA